MNPENNLAVCTNSKNAVESLQNGANKPTGIQTPPTPAKHARNALTASQEVSRHLVEVANAEIQAIDSGFTPSVWGVTTDTFAVELSRAIIKLNSILYAYCIAKWVEPAKLIRNARQRKKHQDTYDAIQIQNTGDTVWIYLPYLPPRQQKGKDIINDLLCDKLAAERSLPCWHSHRIAFHHVYPACTAGPGRDVDNYAYKRTIDLIEAAMRQSDSARCCSLEMDSHFTDKTPSGVYIQITSKSSEFSCFDFPVFEQCPSADRITPV